MEEFMELLKATKEKCSEMDCSKCSLSEGIYQEALDQTYYFCGIRKKPRDWDLEKKRIKQDKKYKKDLEKKYREEQKKKNKKNKK